MPEQDAADRPRTDRSARTALLRAVLAAGAVLTAAGAASAVVTGLGPDPSAAPQTATTAAPAPEAATIPPIPPSTTPATAEPALAGTPAEAQRPPSAAPPAPSPASQAPVPAPQTPEVPVVSAADLPSAEQDAGSLPMRVEYPRLGADLPIVPTGVAEDGQMEIPEDAADAGWYRFGRSPADDAGSTVIAAHAGSDETPTGPLYAIRDGEVGDEVAVTDQDGTRHVYTVTSVERLGKDGLDFTPYFTRTGPERLVLITCGGQWLPERGSYADNIVVVAEPRP